MTPFFLRSAKARPKGILNLAHQRVFARTPWLSPVPLATYSLLRAAYRRVLDGVPAAPALARPGAAPSLLCWFAERGPGGSSGVIHACEGRRIRLRVPGSSRLIVLGTLLQCPRVTSRRIPVRYGLLRDLPPTALRVPFAFYLSGLETLQETTLGSLEDLGRLWEGVKVPCWHRSCSIPESIVQPALSREHAY